MLLQATRDFPVDTEAIAAELRRSNRKFRIFRAIYSGGNKPKDAKRLAGLTGLSKLTILQLASPMAHKGYFQVLKAGGVLSYKKYPDINAIRHTIFRRAASVVEPRSNHERIANTGGDKKPHVLKNPNGRSAKRAAPSINYDVALSFAGEDRRQAEKLAKRLRASGVKVFYDKYEKAALWGANLYERLKEIYEKRSRYCVIFVSKHYKKKLWTRHELVSAQERAFKQRRAYILPIKVDNTTIPSLFATTGHLSLKEDGMDGIFEALKEKLGTRSK